MAPLVGPVLCMGVLGAVLVRTPASLAQAPPGGVRFRIAYATYLGGRQWQQAREAIPGAGGSLLTGPLYASVVRLVPSG